MADSTKQPLDVETLQGLVCERLALDPAKVTPQSHLVDDLGADSLDIMEFGLFIEEQYGIEIPEDDFGELVTLEQAVAYLNRRMGGA